MRADRLLLIALAACALGLWLGTPVLITPYPAQAVWYESAAFFPRLGLGLMVLGALAETLVRRRGPVQTGHEELDSSEMQPRKALAVLALFVAYALAIPVAGFGVSSFAFLLLTARAVGLGWRTGLLLATPMAIALWWVFVSLLKVSFGHGWLI